MASDQEQRNPTCDAPLATDSDLPGELDALLAQLPIDRIRFVVARSECQTNKEAAALIGLSESAVKSWPKEQKELVEQALRLMAQDGLVTALHLRRRSLAKAMAVKIRGLDSADERVRQTVATEIIEWELGRAKQTQDITSGGKPLQPPVSDDGFNRALSTLADAIRETLPGEGTESGGTVGAAE